MSNQPSTGDLLRMLKGIAGRVSDIPDDGYHPSTWWAKEWKIDVSKTRAYIAQGIEAGVVERKDYYIITTGVRRKVPHYKITQPIK